MVQVHLRCTTAPDCVTYPSSGMDKNTDHLILCNFDLKRVFITD